LKRDHGGTGFGGKATSWGTVPCARTWWIVKKKKKNPNPPRGGVAGGRR